jgi:uncharacterized membrane protein (Fun14 family)
MTGDLMPYVGTIGGGFFVGLLAGYAIKKIIKITAVIVGLFIAALGDMQYQRIIDVNWVKIQAVSQNGFTWVANAIIHISNNIGAGHTGALSYLGIPLAASASAGFAQGMIRLLTIPDPL